MGAADGEVKCGVRRLIVAGGETSGAVVESVGVQAVELTSILDPGVPSLRTLGEEPLALALKSGNFGSRDFCEGDGEDMNPLEHLCGCGELPCAGAGVWVDGV
ncbi:MAG: hypothetical protein IPJ98_24445 [Bryobacterales bacterium]|nr:hypothetical protein [Bryobacterales bacterium]